ncbi:4832_t:CDS:2 [Funneliformis mosseae]|uniref:4832_t:CDS:1 n=1 Tax=Funneliformis mosseae TaxID=27381 RepID=A0A9N9CSW7_FUNMO|nr:4832_t:CDS:2 [Funneliformis mosseae]
MFLFPKPENIYHVIVKLVMENWKIKESTNLFLSVTLLSPLKNLIDINNKEPQKSYEENYSFLVKKINSDDGNDISEEDNKRTFEDDALENSSDDSDEDFQLNFDVLETESEKNDFKYAKESFDDSFLWIIIWILKYQERF